LKEPFVAKETTAITPHQQKRMEVFRDMLPATQKVAEAFDKTINKAAKGIVTLKYDMGARLVKVIQQEAEHGSNAVGQLAIYLNFPGGETGLYALSNLAGAFSREFVEAQAEQPMSNGRPLDTGHFFQIMRVKAEKDQLKLFAQVRQECWTVNQLEQEIQSRYERTNRRSGGRNPQPPTSPAAGLQKIYSGAQKLDRFLDLVEESVFAPLETMAPSEVNDRIVEKFDEAQSQLSSLLSDGQVAVDRMKVIRRATTPVKQAATALPPTKKAAAKKTAAKKATRKKTAATS
jgi:hypothetical protein